MYGVMYSLLENRHWLDRYMKNNSHLYDNWTSHGPKLGAYSNNKNVMVVAENVDRRALLWSFSRHKIQVICVHVSTWYILH
jgi:hypothetical protein